VRLIPYYDRTRSWRPDLFYTNYGRRVHGIEVNLCGVTVGLVVRL
jgi:hypothetical protein